MFGYTAWERMRTALLVMGGLVLWIRYQDSIPPRPNFNNQVYFEDTLNSTGTRYRILQRASDASSGNAAAEVLIRPGAPGFYPRLPGSLPLHSHVEAEEVVLVAEGRLGYSLGGDMLSAAAGETVTIPAGVIHTLFNLDPDTPLHLTVSLTPPGRLGEHVWEAWAGLAATHGAKGMHALQLATYTQQAGMLLGGMPPPLAWAFDRLLAPVGQIFFGFKAYHPQFVSLGPGAPGQAVGSSNSNDSAAPTQPTGIESSMGSEQATAEL